MKPIPAAPEAEEESDSGASVPMGVQVLSFLCGIVVAWMGFKSAWQDWRYVDKLNHLERFAETPGKFLKVEVRGDSSGAQNDWYPDVLYEFFVDGKSIWGWRLSYEEEPRPKAYWEQRLAAYKKEGAVTVFYNAAEPKDAIIEKKHEGLSRIELRMALGGLFLLAGVVLAVIPLSAWLRGGFVRK